jgi:uncharacterized membrane protein
VNRRRVAATATAVAGLTALDLAHALRQRREADARDGSFELRQAIAVNRPPDELYAAWRDFERLPEFMRYLESVRVIDAPDLPPGSERTHWIARGPAGTRIEWDAELTEDRPAERICWRTVGDSEIHHSGSISFVRGPRGRGTLVRLEMDYEPPGGSLGTGVARLLGRDPEWEAKDSLWRFKQWMETGEVLTTEGQSAGRSSSTSWRYDSAIRP